MSETLRIAVQKSGRLYEGSMKLLKECGIEVSNGNNQLRVIAANFPVEIFFLRDDDIPEYVQDAVADIGFVGENVVKEKNKEVDTIEKLGFGKCRLSIAILKTGALQSINDLNGKKIATSYPFILSSFLKEKNIQASIHEISGSVEIAPKIGLADAICDLVSSGSTTILPLAEEGWSSVHSVISETDFWNIIEKLKSNGAEGILVIPIEKMIV